MRKFCGNCGAAHTVLEGHQLCSACGETDWTNPIPVAVCLQPVLDKGTGRTGLLIAKRAIQPALGKWALLGGHVEDGETVEMGAKRELEEETGKVMHFRKPRLIQSYANGKGHVLIVSEFRPIDASKVSWLKPCPENSAIDILYEPADLGFPIHTWAAKQWFEDRSFLDPCEDTTEEIAERVLRRGNFLDTAEASNILRTAVEGTAPGCRNDSHIGLDTLFRPYLNDLMELAKRVGEAA